MRFMYKVDVKFVPEEIKSRWIVAKRDKYTAELWFFEFQDSKKRAEDVAQELDDGVVVEVVDA